MKTRLRSASVVTAQRLGQVHAGADHRGEHPAEPLDQRVPDGLAEHGDLEQERVPRVLAAVEPGDQEAEQQHGAEPAERAPTTSAPRKSVKPSSIRVGSGSSASRSAKNTSNFGSTKTASTTTVTTDMTATAPGRSARP